MQISDVHNFYWGCCWLFTQGFPWVEVYQNQILSKIWEPGWNKCPFSGSFQIPKKSQNNSRNSGNGCCFLKSSFFSLQNLKEIENRGVWGTKLITVTPNWESEKNRGEAMTGLIWLNRRMCNFYQIFIPLEAGFRPIIMISLIFINLLSLKNWKMPWTHSFEALH